MKKLLPLIFLYLSTTYNFYGQEWDSSGDNTALGSLTLGDLTNFETYLNSHPYTSGSRDFYLSLYKHITVDGGALFLSRNFPKLTLGRMDSGFNRKEFLDIDITQNDNQFLESGSVFFTSHGQGMGFSINNYKDFVFASGYGINNKEFFRIKYGGKVGIGTSDPKENLSIYSDNASFSLKSSSNSSLIFLGNENNKGADNPAVIKAKNGSLYLGGSTSWFRTGGDIITSTLTILDNRNVGIDTEDPVEKFQIKNSLMYHDGGNKILAFGYSPNLAWQNRTSDNASAGDLDLNSYSAEIRFSQEYGSLSFGVSKDKATAKPTKALTIDRLGTVCVNTNKWERASFSGKVGLAVSGDNGASSSIHTQRIGWTPWEKFKFGTNPDADIAHYGMSLFNETLGSIEKAPKMALSGYYGLKFFTVGKERMHIDNQGNIGIGTSNTQGFLLGVNGKIATEEVKVATYGNWPDYVFKKDYDLPTLEEVEHHIQDKGHLKNIPSAAIIEKDGFFLGEMNAKLLQKIEELTLYTIKQEKKIKGLESKNSSNQLVIDQLNSIVKRLEVLEQKQ